MPAVDPHASAAFYEAVFGWKIRGEREDPAFEDGSGHVIGHFRADHAVAGEAGVRPYVFVENLDQMIEKIVAGGGEIVTEPYPEGDLWVATFRDPAGNEVGVFCNDAARRRRQRQGRHLDFDAHSQGVADMAEIGDELVRDVTHREPR